MVAQLVANCALYAGVVSLNPTAWPTCFPTFDQSHCDIKRHKMSPTNGLNSLSGKGASCFEDMLCGLLV